MFKDERLLNRLQREHFCFYFVLILFYLLYLYRFKQKNVPLQYIKVLHNVVIIFTLFVWACVFSSLFASFVSMYKKRACGRDSQLYCKQEGRGEGYIFNFISSAKNLFYNLQNILRWYCICSPCLQLFSGLLLAFSFPCNPCSVFVYFCIFLWDVVI